jgi:general secretion pathway protein N
MNAAAQRKLTPVLAVLCAVFAVVLVALLAGLGRGVHWSDAAVEASNAPPTKPRAMPVPTALAVYTEVWQRPLFSPDRKPVANAAGEDTVSLGDLELTGIIITPGLRMALLRSTGTGQLVRVREGKLLPDSHWTLAALTPRSASFDGGGERKELALKVSAPEAVKADAQRQPVPGPPSVTSQPSAPVPGSFVPRGAGSRLPVQQQVPIQAEDAQQKARIEALKAAVEKRRAAQAAQPANEGVR